jgi:hypothetical protein
MTPHKTNDSKHWHDRAAHMRALSLTMDDRETIALLNNLANDYEDVADRAVAKSPKAIARK